MACQVQRDCSRAAPLWPLSDAAREGSPTVSPPESKKSSEPSSSSSRVYPFPPTPERDESCSQRMSSSSIRGAQGWGISATLHRRSLRSDPPPSCTKNGILLRHVVHLDTIQAHTFVLPTNACASRWGAPCRQLFGYSSNRNGEAVGYESRGD
jgi:hypothetical protein